MESALLGRGSTAGAFADWDQNGALTDYDDWGNLVIPFSRYATGSLGSVSPLARNRSRNTFLSPLHNDQQPAATETPPPPEFLQWLAR